MNEEFAKLEAIRPEDTALSPVSPDNRGISVQWVDTLTERGARFLSQYYSRRSLLARVGRSVLAAVGASVLPLLPVDREIEVAEATDPNCSQWWMCGAYVERTCSCACGSNNCPSGTSQGSYWIACCRDPSCGCNRLVYYYDCCSSGSLPACCSASNCQCYRGSPGIWCGGSNLKLCCTVVSINYSSTC